MIMVTRDEIYEFVKAIFQRMNLEPSAYEHAIKELSSALNILEKNNHETTLYNQCLRNL